MLAMVEACHPKRKYHTEEQALTILQQLLDSRPVRGSEEAGLLVVYKCPFCGYYHIGHDQTLK